MGVQALSPGGETCFSVASCERIFQALFRRSQPSQPALAEPSAVALVR